MHIRLFVSFALVFTGCTDAIPILALGDSVMTWNEEEGASIPDVVSQELELDVQNNAVAGAYLTAEDNGFFGFLGSDIRSQYVGGEWEWIILNGGANDLNDECQCQDCSENLNSMIDEEGETGDLVHFIEQMISADHRVAPMNYYNVSQDAEYGFANCIDEIASLSERTRLFADRVDELILIEASEVMSPEITPDAYDEDNAHPSMEGSRLIGSLFAEKISDN